MTPVHALELRDVRAAYGSIEVLHGVDLVVPESSVVALLGPNGAGKSTVIKVASGQLVPTAGCFHVAGEHVNGASPATLAAAGVCCIPEGRGVFPNLTVRENLRMMSNAARDPGAIYDMAFERFPQLGARRNQLAGTLSGGEQQMLAMSRGLVTGPSVLLLDEISMGLAPLIVADLYEVVAEIAASGIAVLLVEQFAHTALAVADFAAVMSQGLIRGMGEPADIEDAMAAAYLGAA